MNNAQSPGWQIAAGRKLAHDRNLDEALTAAHQIIAQFPHDVEALLFRAHVYALRDEWELAVVDTSEAIRLYPDEICLYYNRARYLFAQYQHHAALNDLNKALELSATQSESYYLSELYGWRAEILLKLGRRAEARADIEKLDDDYRTWTDRLRTKQDMLKDARR